MSDSPLVFRLLPLVAPLLLALPASPDDPEPEPQPYADLVALPLEIDPATGRRLFHCDLDGDLDPDLVLLADGTAYAIRMVDSLGSAQVVMTGVADACLVPGNGGPERIATVTSSGLWTTTYNHVLGGIESEILSAGAWQGALLVHARASEDDPDEIDYLGLASDARTLLFATEGPTGLSETTEFTVTTDVQEAFLIEWDGETNEPEVAMLTEWGLQVHDLTAPLPALRKVRALGASYGIERIDLGPEDGVAWLTELPPTEFGTQRVLCLFSEYNPTYERVPPVSDDQTSLPFIDLVSGYYDGDADGDLLLLHSDGHSLKRLINQTEQSPYPGAFSYDPNAAFDADLALDLDGDVMGPIAWGPLYNGYSSPILDYVALVSVAGAANLRLLSGESPPIRIQTQVETPFADIYVRTAAAAQSELGPGAGADIAFTLYDVWNNPPDSNAVEVILWRHKVDSNGPAPYPDSMAVDRYICLREWRNITFPELLETAETNPSDDWFTNAYFITAQRVKYESGAIVRRWRKCVIGISMDACGNSTLDFLRNLDAAGLATLAITTEPEEQDCPVVNNGTGAGSVPQVRLPPADPDEPFELPEPTVLFPIPP